MYLKLSCLTWMELHALLTANLRIIAGCALMAALCIVVQHFIRKTLPPKQYAYLRDILLAASWMILASWYASPEERVVVCGAMLACFIGLSEGVYDDPKWCLLYPVIGALCSYFGPAVHFIRFPDNEYIYLAPSFSFIAGTLWFTFFPIIFRYLDEIPGLVGHLLAITFALMLVACIVTDSGAFFMIFAGLSLLAAFWSRFGNMYRQAGKPLASMWGVIVAGTSIIGQSKGIVLSTVLFLSLGLFAIPAIELLIGFVKDIFSDNPEEKNPSSNGEIYSHMLKDGVEHPEAVQGVAGVCALTSIATAWQLWGLAAVIIIAVIVLRHTKKKYDPKKPVLWGVTFDNVSMNYAVSKARGLISNPESDSAQLIVTLNAIGMENVIHDSEFSDAVSKASMILADGSGLCIGMKILGMPVQERVAGIDFAEQLCRLASVEHWPVYFIGAIGNTAKNCANELQKKIPGLIIAGARDGYFDINDTHIPDVIAQSGAKIILVAMGQPRQEKWVMLHRERLGKILAVGVGGAFDVLSGKLNRAPLWVQKIGFEWLYRMLQEPSRWKNDLKLITFMLRIFATRLRLHRK